MLKDIFKTLKNYSHGFHIRNDKTTNKFYDTKVKEIKEKILSDVNRAKEIINAQIKMTKFAQKTSYLGGEEQMKKCNAEWKAADNIMSALKDSKII